MKKILLLLTVIVITLPAFSQLDTINTGYGPNTGSGDPWRTAFSKTNKNDKLLWNRTDSTKNKMASLYWATINFLTKISKAELPNYAMLANIKASDTTRWAQGGGSSNIFARNGLYKDGDSIKMASGGSFTNTTPSATGLDVVNTANSGFAIKAHNSHSSGFALQVRNAASSGGWGLWVQNSSSSGPGAYIQNLSTGNALEIRSSSTGKILSVYPNTGPQVLEGDYLGRLWHGPVGGDNDSLFATVGMVKKLAGSGSMTWPSSSGVAVYSGSSSWATFTKDTTILGLGTAADPLRVDPSKVHIPYSNITFEAGDTDSIWTEALTPYDTTLTNPNSRKIITEKKLADGLAGKLNTSGTAANSALLQGRDSTYIKDNWGGSGISITGQYRHHSTDSIRLDYNEAYYKTDTCTSDSTFAIKKINAKVGGSATITVKGDGTHNIRVLNATIDPNSSTFDKVLNHRNRITIWKDEEGVWYSITNLD